MDKFPPLEKNDIIEIIKDIVSGENLSVCIMLTGGDLLFGTIDYIEYNTDNGKEFEYFNNFSDIEWIIDEKSNKHVLSAEDYITIVYGNVVKALYVKVDFKNITDIRTTDREHSVEFFAQKNNYTVCEKNALEVKIASNKALVLEKNDPSLSKNPKKIAFCFGSNPIKFSKDILVYIDYDFISQTSGGTSLSLSAGPMSIKPGRTAYNIAYDKIKDGIIEKINENLFKSKLEDKRVSGFYAWTDEEEKTIIEGEECIVAFCSDNKLVTSSEATLPIILKEKAIKYPKDVLQNIESRMIFYGELYQLPYEYKDISFDYVLMARVIGYISN